MEEKTQIFKNRTVNIFGSKYSIKFVDEVTDSDDNWIYGITDVYKNGELVVEKGEVNVVVGEQETTLKEGQLAIIDSFDNELASNKKWKFVDCDGQPVFVKTTNAAMKAKMREIKKYLWA